MSYLVAILQKPLDFLENTPPDGAPYTGASQPAKDRKRCVAAGSHSWPCAEIYSRIARAPYARSASTAPPLILTFPIVQQRELNRIISSGEKELHRFPKPSTTAWSLCSTHLCTANRLIRCFFPRHWRFHVPLRKWSLRSRFSMSASPDSA